MSQSLFLDSRTTTLQSFSIRPRALPEAVPHLASP
jgi:hypothetical protein